MVGSRVGIYGVVEYSRYVSGCHVDPMLINVMV